MTAVEFDGPCPFLTCAERAPHAHPACPECGAVRYGNVPGCATCTARYDDDKAAREAVVERVRRVAWHVGDGRLTVHSRTAGAVSFGADWDFASVERRVMDPTVSWRWVDDLLGHDLLTVDADGSARLFQVSRPEART